MCAFISKNENNLSNFQSDGKTIFNKKLQVFVTKLSLNSNRKGRNIFKCFT